MYIRIYIYIRPIILYIYIYMYMNIYIRPIYIWMVMFGLLGADDPNIKYYESS